MIHKVIQRIEDVNGTPILDENGNEQYITISETQLPDLDPEPTPTVDINSLTTEQLIQLKQRLDALGL